LDRCGLQKKVQTHYQMIFINTKINSLIQ